MIKQTGNVFIANKSVGALMTTDIFCSEEMETAVEKSIKSKMTGHYCSLSTAAVFDIMYMVSWLYCRLIPQIGLID